jgi:hypothetical protein
MLNNGMGLWVKGGKGVMLREFPRQPKSCGNKFGLTSQFGTNERSEPPLCLQGPSEHYASQRQSAPQRPTLHLCLYLFCNWTAERPVELDNALILAIGCDYDRA